MQEIGMQDVWVAILRGKGAVAEATLAGLTLRELALRRARALGERVIVAASDGTRVGDEKIVDPNADGQTVARAVFGAPRGPRALLCVNPDFPFLDRETLTRALTTLEQSGAGRIEARGGGAQSLALEVFRGPEPDSVAPFVLTTIEAISAEDPAGLAIARELWPKWGDRFGTERLSALELVVFDFDGVFTDDAVILDENGKESVRCSRGDGMGIERLKAAGVKVAVISKERNKVVAARCRKLDLPCWHGVDDKLTLLQRYCAELGVAQENVAFVGNDVNDVASMAWAGVGVAVASARGPAMAVADWRTNAAGGEGAVRELCEAILECRPS